jgi:hypothetical protein
MEGHAALVPYLVVSLEYSQADASAHKRRGARRRVGIPDHSFEGFGQQVVTDQEGG